MQRIKIRSRLKAQLTKFMAELREGLSKPLRAFVGEMWFGLQARQDVKRSQMARSLEEEIPLIKTEDRLSRNLKAKDREGQALVKNVVSGRFMVRSRTSSERWR